MHQHIPTPEVLVYKEINKGKYTSVKHYDLESGNVHNTSLSHLLNISKDRKCAKSSPIYWLQTHNGKNWVKPRLTGLFKTTSSDLYKGDIGVKGVKTHLLMFQFSNQMDSLIVYYFHQYYTKDLNMILKFITA